MIRARLNSADEQSRTVDPTIFSRVLYQLSYVGKMPPAFEQSKFYRILAECQAYLNVRIISQARQPRDTGEGFTHQ